MSKFRKILQSLQILFAVPNNYPLNFTLPLKKKSELLPEKNSSVKKNQMLQNINPTTSVKHFYFF